MVSKRMLSVFLCLYLLAAALFGRYILRTADSGSPDMTAVNRIVKQTALDLETGQFSPPEDCPYDYMVLDQAGRPVYRTSGRMPETAAEAVRARCLVLSAGGEPGGTILIDTGFSARTDALKKRLFLLLTIMTGMLVIPAVLYARFLERRILLPFERLKDFAGHIAAGNLDFPLPMDRGHVFGAFTESFDLMREQLREARHREALADRSKKELTASLSHDIKTPVASIRLLSELLLVTQTDPSTREKLEAINGKTEQIDRLVTNMLQASLEELGELSVNPAEVSSTGLADIIKRADYCGKVTLSPVPGCILVMDSFRMEQVIGNIINNAYKYADTAVTVVSALTAEGLRVEFKDYGKGVPEEELPHIFQKYYRSAGRAGHADGSGLGLYIAKSLMERMNGIIDCYNRPDGFSVVLFIPLSRPLP